MGNIIKFKNKTKTTKTKNKYLELFKNNIGSSSTDDVIKAIELVNEEISSSLSLADETKLSSISPEDKKNVMELVDYIKEAYSQRENFERKLFDAFGEVPTCFVLAMLLHEEAESIEAEQAYNMLNPEIQEWIDEVYRYIWNCKDEIKLTVIYDINDAPETFSVPKYIEDEEVFMYRNRLNTIIIAAATCLQPVVVIRRVISDDNQVICAFVKDGDVFIPVPIENLKLGMNTMPDGSIIKDPAEHFEELSITELKKRNRNLL